MVRIKACGFSPAYSLGRVNVKEGIIVFQLIWNVTEQLRGPVPVPDAVPSSVAKTKVGPSPSVPGSCILSSGLISITLKNMVSNSARDSHWQLYPA